MVTVTSKEVQDKMIQLIIWDLGDTVNTPPPGGQDAHPIDTYSEIRLRDGVVEALSTLKERGYRQAVLSNTAVSDSASASRMLEKFGVLSYFEYVFASASELDPSKPGKPDKEVFDHVLQVTQTSAEHAVMVGNSWDNDILGANRSGIHAIWLQNTDVSVRCDDESGTVSPPWVLPVWDVQDVPDAVRFLEASTRRTFDEIIR